MSEIAPELVSSRRQVKSKDGLESCDSFLRLYSRVEAISKEANAPGEAIKFFHCSREKLEAELQHFYSENRVPPDSKLQEISADHAFLSLIHWLYPNHMGYNRLRNAVKMFQHATAAQATSKSKMDFSYAVGLMVQLRITPFLVKAKKKSVGDLTAARSSATEFLSSTSPLLRSELVSMVADGLGFSFFLFERDLDSSLAHLRKAESSFESCVRSLALNQKSREVKLPDPLKNRIQFLRSFACALYWDIGICYEGKAEGAEGEEMLVILRKARSMYRKALDYAMSSPWYIYRAMSAYNLSGTYFKEGTTKFEKRKALPLLKKSVSIAEESLNWFNLWSSFEGDFLGGSWIASFYQHLANYSDESSKEKFMQRSVQLAKKADDLINNRKVGMSRYKSVNVGDIFLRNSEYNRQIAAELRYNERANSETSNEAQILELLSRSLADCLKSRTFYQDQAFGSRKISSDLLAGDICYDLLNSKNLGEEQRKTYSSKAMRYFRDAAKTSESLGLSETLATSRWRLAQVFDKDARFKQSAIEYRKAHESFEHIRNSPVNARLYEESSRYMLAWCNIEEAKAAHSFSNFEEASTLYQRASSLIASTRRWGQRSHLYAAESLIEKAEKLSLAESSGMAIDFFSGAVETLAKLDSELSSDDSIEAKSFRRLGKHLSSFCNARILLEKSKDDFRKGNVERSMEGLSKAEIAFSNLSQDYGLTNPLEANELMSLASLCSALKYFQKAQIEGNPSLIREAATVFSTASEQSKSTTLKPLLKGLSSFADFLYSSKLVEQSLESSIDVERLSECDRAIDSAERTLSRLGNKTFLIMLRASKHILDGSIKINAAEREVEDQEAKRKLFSQAQRSLSLASKYYEELGSSEKLKESLRLLTTVKQNRELIPLANAVFAEVASSQMIYSAISSTSILGASPEDSARQIDSSFLAMDVSLANALVSPGEELSITFVLSNLGKERAIATRIQEALPKGIELDPSAKDKVKIRDGSLLLNQKLEPGLSETISFIARPVSAGEFTWHPTMFYQDSKGNQKTSKVETLKIVVEPKDLASIVVALRSKKETIERSLADGSQSEETLISLREEISRVEEELHRFNNEYENLVAQLDQVRQDLHALSTMQDESLRAHEKRTLETEERVLVERIERRRPLFQQQ